MQKSYFLPYEIQFPENRPTRFFDNFSKYKALKTKFVSQKQRPRYLLRTI